MSVWENVVQRVQCLSRLLSLFMDTYNFMRIWGILLVCFNPIGRASQVISWFIIQLCVYIYTYILVGGLEHDIFPYIGNVIIPTDELIFFRGVGQPPTSIYQV